MGKFARICHTTVAVVVLSLGQARAHPHVFIDGGANFAFAEDGTLQTLRILWIYDEYYSLTTLLDYGLDPDADGFLDEQEQTFLADSQTAHWIAEYKGDSYLWHKGNAIGLGPPQNAQASLADGRIHITFDRAVELPFRPDASSYFKAYDPTFYVAYAITEQPKLENATGCSAKLIAFEADDLAQSKLDELAQLGVYELPEDQSIGEIFADRIEFTCD